MSIGVEIIPINNPGARGGAPLAPGCGAGMTFDPIAGRCVTLIQYRSSRISDSLKWGTDFGGYNQPITPTTPLLVQKISPTTPQVQVISSPPLSAPKQIPTNIPTSTPTTSVPAKPTTPLPTSSGIPVVDKTIQAIESPLSTLAGVFGQIFGGQLGQTPIVGSGDISVVPTGAGSQPTASSGGISPIAIFLVAGIAIGGYYAYKKGWLKL